MPKFAIWGRNKFGVAKCYALYVAQDEIKEYTKRAEAEGWTELISGAQAQPEMFPETNESESSVEPS